MKKLSSLIFALFVSVTTFAQFTVHVASPGIINLSYGASNDYSLYEPGFEVPTFYAHVWTNASDNSTGIAYQDNWYNSNVTMNWDSNAGAYIGTINLNNKVFTDGNKVLPGGTTVTNLGFVFKDLQSGNTKNSTDLQATDFGFTTTVTTTLGVSTNSLSIKSIVENGYLHSSLKGNVEITVYEMSGKLVKSFTAVVNGNTIDLNVTKTGLYLVKLTNGSENEVVKFAK